MYGSRAIQAQLPLLSQQQRQSLKLLQFNAGELETYINSEFLTNPLLELQYVPGNNKKIERPPSYSEPSIPSFETSWRLALKEQLYELRTERNRLEEYMVDLLDDHGFLPYNDGELAELFGCSFESCVEARARLQRLEPQGIGSQNVGEYLIYQLKSQNVQLSPPLLLMLRNFATSVSSFSIRELAHRLGVEVSQVRNWYAIIKELKPYPINENISAEIYIFPELLVESVGGCYVVRWLDERDYVPVISPYYTKYLCDAPSEEEKNYIRESVRRARWLISAIEQRKQTVLRIGEQIVAHQQAFFDGGMLRTVPQIMVAETLGVHRSTVSRAIAGKYLTCKRGIFPLKAFFSTGGAKLEFLEEEMEVSRESIKEEIRMLVKQENSTRPHSDSKLAALLEERGIRVSRRTVAKYREECGIRCTTERRKI